MAVLVGLTFWLASCVAHKLHKWAAAVDLKKLLYVALSLMAISLFAISGDVHYSKSSTATATTTTTRQQLASEEQQQHQLFDTNIRKKAVAVALLCIFMLIYAVGVRPSVATLEDRFIGARSDGTATLLYKAINTTTHWLTLPLLLIHLFLLNWSHIGLGWILVVFAVVCLLAITYVAVFFPDSAAEEELTDAATVADNEDPNEIRLALDDEQVIGMARV